MKKIDPTQLLFHEMYLGSTAVYHPFEGISSVRNVCCHSSTVLSTTTQRADTQILISSQRERPICSSCGITYFLNILASGEATLPPASLIMCIFMSPAKESLCFDVPLKQRNFSQELVAKA